MFISIKEYEKHLNTLNSERKIKHIDNTMNELKEKFVLCDYRKKIRDIKSKLMRLENIRSCIKKNNKPPINPCAKMIIDGSVWKFMSDNESSVEEYMKVPDSNESFDDEDIEVSHSSEKSSDYFKFLKYTIPAHYDGVFD